MDHNENIAFWHDQLIEDIRLLRLAEAMYKQQKSNDRRSVIYYARSHIRNEIATALRNLGGLGVEW